MKSTDQNNIEAVTAFIESLSQANLDRTEQFFSGQIEEAFPDRQYAVDEIMAQGEKVVARLVMTATHQGTFAGIAPTGRAVKTTQFREYRVTDGQVAEQFVWFDTGLLMMQLQAK